MTTQTANQPANQAASKLTDGGRKAHTELTDLRMNAASVVDNGDNPEAHVLLLKGQRKGLGGFWDKMKAWAGAAAEKMGQPRTVSEILAAQRFDEKFRELRWALYDSVSSIMECADPAVMAATLSRTVAEFSAEAKKLVDAMGSTEKSAEFDALMASMLAGAEHVAQHEKRAPFMSVLRQLEAFEFPKAATTNVTTPEAEPAQGNQEEAAMSIKSNPTAAGSEQLEAILKRQEALEKQNAELAALVKSQGDANKALEEQLASAKRERAEAVFLVKAEKLGVPGFKADVIAGVLKSAYAAGKEQGEATETVIKTLTEQVLAAKLFGAPVGSSGDDEHADEDGMDAHEQLTAIAAKLRKADPKLTEEAAYVKAAEQNPHLAAEAL